MFFLLKLVLLGAKTRYPGPLLMSLLCLGFAMVISIFDSGSLQQDMSIKKSCSFNCRIMIWFLLPLNPDFRP